MANPRRREDGWLAVGGRLLLTLLIGLVVVNVEVLRDVVAGLVGLIVADAVFSRLGARRWLPVKICLDHRRDDATDRGRSSSG
jgi:hypothetical protein